MKIEPRTNNEQQSLVKFSRVNFLSSYIMQKLKHVHGKRQHKCVDNFVGKKSTTFISYKQFLKSGERIAFWKT